MVSNLSPLRAIRAKCLDCCCWQEVEVRNCPSVKCALHPFRMGKNPNRKGLGNAANFNATQNYAHSTRDTGGEVAHET